MRSGPTATSCAHSLGFVGAGLALVALVVAEFATWRIAVANTVRPVAASSTALELAAVRRRQGRGRPARLPGDEHIVRPDGRAEPSQVGADVCCLLCVRLLERRDIEAARRHEQGDLLLVLAVHQLVMDDDRQGERRGRRLRLAKRVRTAG